MELINCTDRLIFLQRQDGVVIQLPASPAPMRLAPSRMIEGELIAGVKNTIVQECEIENLPPERDGAILVVEPEIAMLLATCDRWDIATVGEVVGHAGVGLLPIYGGLIGWDTTEDAGLPTVNPDAELYWENN